MQGASAPAAVVRDPLVRKSPGEAGHAPHLNRLYHVEVIDRGPRSLALLAQKAAGIGPTKHRLILLRFTRASLSPAVRQGSNVVFVSIRCRCGAGELQVVRSFKHRRARTNMIRTATELDTETTVNCNVFESRICLECDLDLRDLLLHVWIWHGPISQFTWTDADGTRQVVEQGKGGQQGNALIAGSLSLALLPARHAMQSLLSASEVVVFRAL